MNILRNLVLFKLGWIGCVMFAAAGKPWLSLLSVLIVVALHLPQLAAPLKEALLLATAVLIGLLWESALVALGIVEYPGHDHAWLAPVWILAMWALFATTINHGLAWVKRYWVYAALAGAIGGPMAFYAGANLGAVAFPNTTLAMVVIGAGWAVLLPLLALLADTIIDSTLFEPRDRSRPAAPSARLAAQVQSLVQRGDAL
ncbi:MAG: DUF2878 domain-containing protein [Gammaproteobacteria bacterium]